MINEKIILQLINSINSILYLVVFCFIIDKVRDRRELTRKTDYIKLFIIGVFIFLVPKGYMIPILFLLLTFLCRILFVVSWKDSAIYSSTFFIGYNICFSMIYVISRSIFYNVSIRYTLLNYDVPIDIVLNVILITLLIQFENIRKIKINIKCYIYIGLTVVVNCISIICLYIASNYILNLVEFNAINLNHNFSEFMYITRIILPATIVICNIILVIIINNLIKNIESNSKLKLINDKLDMQYNYYLSIQESQMKVRRLYHDINNHIICMKQIKNNDIYNYIESINEELKDFQNKFDTGNRILDIILNEKSLECRKNNIDLYCDINFSKCTFIDMIDVAAIFANILDNAIEACQKVSVNKYIKLRGTIVKSYYVIKCENSKSNEIKVRNNKIISSKSNKFIHGIGLQSVNSSLKKYDGEFKIKNEKNIFSLKICIPLKND